MAHEFASNKAVGTNDQWGATWHLLLRMIKAGYWVRASSDGVTKVVSDDPTAHVGNTGTGFAPQTVGNSGSAASIINSFKHPYGYLVTFSGMAGLVAPTPSGGQSEGNFITVSGCATALFNGTHQIYEVHASNSCTVLVRTFSAIPTTDANNGTIVWAEKSALAGSISYGSYASRQWWCCIEGMQTFQLMTTTVPGSFVRGEVVTQATTGATAECLGVVWDPLTSVGWMIVQPRMGHWSATDVITGSVSAATMTPTVLYKFRRQWVFVKGNTTDTYTGSSWYQCINETTEAADLRSTQAASAACTATVPPGGSVTAGNRFYTTVQNTYVLRCQNNATYDGATALVHTDGVYHPNLNTPNGKLQIAVANAMPRATRCADGTWWLFHGNTNIAGGGGNLLACFRLDGGQPGEAEIVCHFALGDSASNPSHRINTLSGGASSHRFDHDDFLTNPANLNEWNMLYRRAYGSASGGVYIAWLYTSAPMSSINVASQTGLLYGRNWGSVLRPLSHPAVVAPILIEPLGMGIYGRLRWGYLIGLGANVYDTLNNRQLICISQADTSLNRPGFCIGPWDQTTDPVQA